ncbi:MAG TPA: monovalent cation/H(+) antiporter subunit G [Candidatus Binataceae bacterium]|nr:monovalent cation/H(+) antiporter subunit G [Candidatus Binataceae bacterium]
MSAGQIAEYVLLFGGVGIVLLSCLGLTVGNSFDRLHYLGPPTVLASVMIVGAVVIQDLSIETILKAILVALSFISASPILTHATGAAGFEHRSELDTRNQHSVDVESRK